MVQKIQFFELKQIVLTISAVLQLNCIGIRDVEAEAVKFLWKQNRTRKHLIF